MNCDTHNQEASRFCEGCGGALPVGCLACAAPLGPRARFCGQCGRAVSSVPPAPASPPAPVLAQLERKRVTVLFADMDGSTALIRSLDPEQAMDRLDPVLAVMTEAVGRFGGTVARVMGDGVMALFGAPHAQEDHAAHACMAARAMLDRAGALPGTPSLRLGLNSGAVVVRRTGPGPSDLDVTGDVVHLASRLERLARPGTACLSAETARLARGFVELAPLGRHAVPGFEVPVECFSLLAASDRSTWEARSGRHPLTRFAGRGSELGLLAEARARAERGAGQVVTVVAEAGMGKSRLLREFLAAPDRAPPSGGLPAGGLVLRAAALSSDTGTGFHLAAGLLRARLDAAVARPGAEAADAAALERQLDAALARGGAHGAARAPALRALLGLPVRDGGWEALPPPERRRRMVAALCDALLEGTAERLVVVVAEDLHWADDASLEALSALAGLAGGCRLLLLATARPEDEGRHGGPAGHARLEGHSWCSRIALPPLPPELAEELLREVVGDAPGLAALRRRLVEQTAGTPLFLEEMARSLRESGVLDAGGAAAVTPAGSLPGLLVLPDTVQAVLAARLDRLEARCRLLLQTAAVVGQDVPRHLLVRLAERAEDLQADLDRLRDAEFLFETRPGAPGAGMGAAGGGAAGYSFKHALTHAVAYESLLLRRRRDGHARVLRLLQDDVRDGALPMPERMALHAMRGEVWEDAARLAQAAGLRANARSAWGEAVGFFDWALAALARLPELDALRRLGVEVRLSLRVALAALGEFGRIVTLLEEARGLALAAGDHDGLAAIDNSACTILTNLGRLEEAVQAGERGHATALARADAAGTLTAGFALGQARWFRGDLAGAAAVLEAAAPLARGPLRHADLGTTGTASVLLLVCLSKTRAITGAFDAALALQREAEAIAAATGRPYDRSYASLAAGFLLFERDDAAGAVLALGAALEGARGNGIALLVPSVARYLGPALVATGRHEEARALMAEALRVAEARGLVGLSAWCRLGWAGALPPGDPAALAAATEALALATRHGYRPIEAQGLRLLARLRRHDGREAASLLRRASALAARLGMEPERARAMRDLHGLHDPGGLDALGDPAPPDAAIIPSPGAPARRTVTCQEFTP